LPIKTLHTIRCCAEFLPVEAVSDVPHSVRGIYALLQQPRNKPNVYNVVYIGISKTGVKARLAAHKRSQRKQGKWTHFSVYSVWPNISDEQITELEGLFRAIYRRDAKANGIAIAKGSRKLRILRDNKFSPAKWLTEI
jgi:hypothetical protein